MPAPSNESKVLNVPAGHVLFRPSDECPGFVAVRRGSIKVLLTGASGREIVLYRVAPGDVCLQTFACLAEGRRYSALGIAESELVAELIPRRAFERRLLDEPGFRAAILASIARRFADYEQMVETLAFTGLEARVAAALLRLADEAGVVHATHEAIAVEIGSAREAVSRQVGAFGREGLLEQQRGRVLLRDRSSLARRASGAP
jgi:CRP/FNR family transcriptional regulator